MSEFWFIRHGQSATNVGLPSESDAITALTALGETQAEFVAGSIVSPPNLFVVSPYVRTSQTAAPTLAKFPGVPVETWTIQEFSYLSYTQYAGTTTRDRRRLSMKFFRKADPDLVLGVGGESFNQFIDRVQSCFCRLSKSEHERIILFGHGWFIRAGLWVLLRDANSESERNIRFENIRKILDTSSFLLSLYNRISDKASMRSFLLFSAAVETPNCSILKYNYDEISGEPLLFNFDISHIPDEYRKVSLRNR